MRQISKYVTSIGIAVTLGFLGGVAVNAAPSHAANDVLFAQANDTKGKSENNTGRPGNQAPGNQAPINGGQPPSSTLQNAPPSGVPARCASVADATERQKCMDTPKGQ